MRSYFCQLLPYDDQQWNEDFEVTMVMTSIDPLNCPYFLILIEIFFLIYLPLQLHEYLLSFFGVISQLLCVEALQYISVVFFRDLTP
jgi:hypothetical protein